MSSVQSAPFGLPALDFDSSSSRSMSLDSVAQLFQSILQEDRLAPLTRVWLARLQMPLIRLTLAQPTMFGNESNPGIDLVTQIVSCALEGEGEGHSAPADALDTEIQRLVLKIEKNAPGVNETYSKALAEFKAYLSRHRRSDEALQQVADPVRQQEQKDVFIVQCSILLRHLLHGMQVRMEVRDFLFNVWAEVLASASMQYGHQHATTLALKQAVTALAWATGAQKTRRSRARVIKDVPILLQTLRDGMDLLGLPEAEKNRHITILSAPMMDAFVGKKAADPVTLPELGHAPGLHKPRPRSTVRSKTAPASQLPGMEVIEDFPSSQGWHFWEGVQTEQVDQAKPVEASDSTWANPRGHRER